MVFIKYINCNAINPGSTVGLIIISFLDLDLIMILRRCLMSPACDMFTVLADKHCLFFPHVKLKNRLNQFQVKINYFSALVETQ